MIDVIRKRFEKLDECTTFEKGKFETVTVGGMTIGRTAYAPGWMSPGYSTFNWPHERLTRITFKIDD